jgi:integrase
MVRSPVSSGCGVSVPVPPPTPPLTCRNSDQGDRANRLSHRLCNDPATGGGRRVWRSGYRTQRDAERARVKLLGEIDQGGYVEPTAVTTGGLLRDRWLPAVAVRLRGNTLAMYRQNIEAHIVPRLGHIPLQRLTPPDLNALYAQLVAAGRRDGNGGLSERTVRIQHVIRRRALSDAVRWGLLARNPVQYADPPRGRSAEAPVWSPQQRT